jgi:hypothetical protein
MTNLSKREQFNVRAALHYLHAQIGTWIALARAVRSKRVTLRRIRAGQRVRLGIARRVAALAGMSLADLLAGKFVPEGTCFHCGRPRGADGTQLLPNAVRVMGDGRAGSTCQAGNLAMHSRRRTGQTLSRAPGLSRI